MRDRWSCASQEQGDCGGRPHARLIPGAEDSEPTILCDDHWYQEWDKRLRGGDMFGIYRRRAGRHRRTRRPEPARRGRRALTIELVDTETRLAHELTPDAHDAGWAPGGRYIALCGTEVVPAAMEEPGRGPCWMCRSKIAGPRSRIA